MPTLKSSEQVRDEFLKFFEEKGHEVVASDALVPHNDPTLLFTNAGMNQFKDVFLGTGQRPYNRAVDTQKCLRVSGKHNDLEEVGYDTYHHTFFEMLGNWSFGDYFKREAIRWAWELLVEKWGLDPDRLYATVHEGDHNLGLDADEEAASFWKEETGINVEHILFCGSKDNFWMMGDTGPCGPCSEIHIDLRSDEERNRVPGKTLVNADDPRVMEIWNLVFIQYNAQADGSLEALENQHVDTGMGFERVVAVLQQKSSNYDTDLFSPILEEVARRSPVEALEGYDRINTVDEGLRAKYRIALRVVADHLRTIAFAIADGVMPGNVGRGYVIRRILRRAVRYGYQTLELHEPFLHQIVGTLAEKMGSTFPELVRNQDYIERVIKAEEESFLETLGTGIVFFERITPYLKMLSEGVDRNAVLSELREDRQTLSLLEKAYVDERSVLLDRFVAVAAEKQMPGEVAFLLHDTYGFPVDLTQLMAREEGFDVDMTRYSSLMEEQRGRARAATSFKIDQRKSDTWHVLSEGEDSVFVGYDTNKVEDTTLRAHRRVQLLDDEVQHQLLLDKTPFYAESGGQVGDTGCLYFGEEVVHVLDTQKEQGRIIHIVDRMPHNPMVPIRASVDTDRLNRIKKHHSVTHLMHAALQEILGSHVKQKGSLVAPDHLRFDFSHFERVSEDELRAVETRVNEIIQRNLIKQEERSVPMEEALSRGAMALFGEKYGDTVRVITFDPHYSVELCGGIHVEASGEIGLFKFISEGSVAAGVRRVVAVAGLDAVQHLHREMDELGRVRGHFKSIQRPSDEEVADLIEQNRRLEKALEAERQQRLAQGLDAIVEGGRMLKGIRLAVGRVEPTDMNALRTLGETLRERLGSGSVGVLGALDPEGEKVYLVATVADDLVREKKIQAGKLVGVLARLVGGGGGGRPALATAGGRQPEHLDKALASVEQTLGEMLA